MVTVLDFVSPPIMNAKFSLVVGMARTPCGVTSHSKFILRGKIGRPSVARLSNARAPDFSQTLVLNLDILTVFLLLHLQESQHSSLLKWCSRQDSNYFQT